MSPFTIKVYLVIIPTLFTWPLAQVAFGISCTEEVCHLMAGLCGIDFCALRRLVISGKVAWLNEGVRGKSLV